MNDSPPPSSPRPTSIGATTASIAAAVIAAVAALWLGGRLGSVEDRLDQAETRLQAIERTTQLIRLEGKSQGRGIGAIVEQIEYWAPQLATATTPMPVTETIEAALNECLDAVEALGRRAWPDLLAALEGPTARDDETRKWLLKAILRSRPDDGRQLLTEVVRGTRLAPSARLRFFAADQLLDIDSALAGEVLAQVLQVESAQGVTRQVPPGLAPEYERVIGTNQFPEFFNLIDRFVRSGHPDVENVLRMILGRAEHDTMTYQVCIRELGRLGSRAALPRIRELFESPPLGRPNPIFANVCLQAIADIEGADAKDWFRLQLRSATSPIVVTKLQDLVKQL